MSVRRVKLVFVSSVLIAALGAISGLSFAATPAVVLTRDAYSAFARGDVVKSINLYTQAIDSRALGPDDLSNALYNRALANQNGGFYSRAVDDYTAALNMGALASDLRARILYNRGLAQLKLGKSALAVEDFTSALLINTSFAEAYLARGSALRSNGQYLFSISDYERALKYNYPQPARVLYGEALAYEALNRPAQARHFLKQAQLADASFAPARDRLKVLSAVAESDDTQSDPIFTASFSANPTNNIDVAQQVMPKGVEPPAALIGTAALPSTPIAAVAAANKAIVSAVPNIPRALAQADKTARSTIKLAKAAKVKKGKPESITGIEQVDDIKTASITLASSAPASASTRWIIQLSSTSSEDGAWSSWKTMQKTHKVLASHKPIVVKADLGAKGTFFRLRLQGYGTQQAAQSECGKLKTGGVSCYVAKDNG